jgi:hypothetical protein
MPTRTQVQVVLVIAVIVWAGLLFVEGVTLKPSYLKPFSLTVAVVILILLAFERWLWRIPPVAKALHRPVLRGTWKGQLKSNWIDPRTGQEIEPIDIFLLVRQTYSTVSLRLMTQESTSRSLVASLESHRDEIATLTSTYQNIPGLLIQDRSRIHHGALMLEVHGSSIKNLSGFYWTDRDTKGEVSLESRSKNVYTNFEAASAAM